MSYILHLTGKFPLILLLLVTRLRTGHLIQKKLANSEFYFLYTNKGANTTVILAPILRKAPQNGTR
jgi:hypothetical protein